MKQVIAASVLFFGGVALTIQGTLLSTGFNANYIAAMGGVAMTVGGLTLLKIAVLSND